MYLKRGRGTKKVQLTRQKTTDQPDLGAEKDVRHFCDDNSLKSFLDITFTKFTTLATHTMSLILGIDVIFYDPILFSLTVHVMSSDMIQATHIPYNNNKIKIHSSFTLLDI